jgi:diguanylate cyclase (GGDEF)-like protein
VIDSLAEITRYLDKELIEHSLLTTLSEFERDQELRLYKVVRHEPNLELALVGQYHQGIIVHGSEINSHSIEEGLAELIERSVAVGEMVVVPDAIDGKSVYVHPIYDQEGEMCSLLVQICPPLQSEDERLIGGLLRIYANYLSLLDLSQRDKLTSLLNRDRLHTKVMQILSRQRLNDGSKHQPRRRRHDEQRFWLGVIDIDHFKQVNDAYGHLIGDEILIVFARLMHEVFRNDDLLFRYGGEEFVVIIRADDKDNARCAFERFRTRVAEHEFPTVGSMTASLGVVEIDRQESPADVIDEADRALYWAKEHGRNRLAFYQDLVDAGEIVPKAMPTAGEINLF